MILIPGMKKINRMDCFDNNIIFAISKFYDFNVAFYFFKMFNVIYEDHENFLINNHLDYGNPYRFTGLDALKDIYNLDYEIVMQENLEPYSEIKKKIINCLNNSIPVAITIDSYGCEWSHFYLDQHMYHSILLLGYNYEKDVFLSQDYYLDCEQVEISSKSLEEYLSWILFFIPQDMNKNISTDKLTTFIKNYLQKYNADEFVSGLYRLYNSFYDYQYKKQDEDYYRNPDKSYLLTRFIALSWSRFNFANAIKYFDKLYNKEYFKEVSNKIENLAVEWEKMRNVFAFFMMKANVNNQFVFRSKQLEKMKQLIEIEREIYEELLIICKSI